MMWKENSVCVQSANIQLPERQCHVTGLIVSGYLRQRIRPVPRIFFWKRGLVGRGRWEERMRRAGERTLGMLPTSSWAVAQDRGVNLLHTTAAWHSFSGCGCCCSRWRLLPGYFTTTDALCKPHLRVHTDKQLVCTCVLAQSCVSL